VKAGVQPQPGTVNGAPRLSFTTPLLNNSSLVIVSLCYRQGGSVLFAAVLISRRCNRATKFLRMPVPRRVRLALATENGTSTVLTGTDKKC
jgi:hypothetical protein